MTSRPNPRQFGRKIPATVTREQRVARFAAYCCFVLFAIALGAGLAVPWPGASAVLVTVAFMSLFVGMCAAHEAKPRDPA